MGNIGDSWDQLFKDIDTWSRETGVENCVGTRILLEKLICSWFQPLSSWEPSISPEAATHLLKGLQSRSGTRTTVKIRWRGGKTKWLAGKFLLVEYWFVETLPGSNPGTKLILLNWKIFRSKTGRQRHKSLEHTTKQGAKTNRGTICLSTAFKKDWG